MAPQIDYKANYLNSAYSNQADPLAMKGNVKSWGGNIYDKIVGSNTPDGKGGMNTTMGLGGLALGAFDSWNSWNQGNKMYDLQEEALGFSKDQFWNNFLMKRDAYNREINTNNFRNHQRQSAAQNPNMTDAEQNAIIDKGFTTYMNDGEAIRDLQGNESNVTNVDRKYYGDGYGDNYENVTGTDVLNSQLNNDARSSAFNETLKENPTYFENSVKFGPVGGLDTRGGFIDRTNESNGAATAEPTPDNRNQNNANRQRTINNSAREYDKKKNTRNI